MEQAIARGDITSILFVDDDVLLPLDALGYLASLKLPIVGCSYVKKNAMPAHGTLAGGENTATETIATGGEDIFNNAVVSCEDPKDRTPRRVNCLGLGAVLVDVDVFRKLPEPYFKFIKDPRDPTKVATGEDSYFVRHAATALGVPSYIVPGLVGIHCDFKQSKEQGRGVYYGPSWLVSPDHTIKPEFVDRYTHFTMKPGDLFVEGNCDNVFGNFNPDLVKK